MRVVRNKLNMRTKALLAAQRVISRRGDLRNKARSFFGASLISQIGYSDFSP
jgi:hypothetical protein